MSHEPETTSDPNDLDAARRDVARAEERLSNRWRAAKMAGEKTVGKAMSAARPVIVGLAVVGGVALLVTRFTGGNKRPKRRASAGGEPSLVAEMTRAAALALASAAARHLADRYLHAPTLPAGAAKVRG